MSDESVITVLDKLAKWQRFFASWQLGTRLENDGESRAVRDHREATILMRAELSALAGLLIRKGAFTQLEFQDAMELEGRQLDHDYEETYPGFRTSAAGLHMKMPEALETMRKLGFPA